MKNFFQIIPTETAKDLGVKTKTLFNYQSTKERARTSLVDNTANTTLQANVKQVENKTNQYTANLESIEIKNTDMTSNFQDMSHITIRLSNRYYAMYESNTTVEDLVWSADC